MATTRFKSNPLPLQFNASDIDAGNGIIRNVVMLQAGEAKGHGVHLDAEFVRNVIAYDIKHHSKSGVKARFGHPSFSDTTMGTQMGYFKNFRYDNSREAGIADLHLLESANLSPDKPNMRDWMISMAKESPEFVMSSIVFSSSGVFHYDEEGKKKKGYADGDSKTFLGFDEEKGARHYYTDLVEAGAATDSLFSQQFNQDKFAVQAVEFLQEHPAVHQFLKENPNKLTEFAAKADIKLPSRKLSLREHLASLFQTKDTDFDTLLSEETAQQIADLELEIKTRSDQFANKENQLETQIEELQKQLQERDARIAELEKQPAEPPLIGGAEPAQFQGQKTYCSVTKEVMDGNFF